MSVVLPDVVCENAPCSRCRDVDLCRDEALYEPEDGDPAARSWRCSYCNEPCVGVRATAADRRAAPLA